MPRRLRGLARELGARFAAVADPDAYGELKAELSGSGIEAAAGAAPSSKRRNGPPTGSWRRSPAPRASSRRWPRPSAALPSRSPTRNVWSAPARCSCAGPAAAGATVLPVDSEHNAIFQALGAGRREDVRRIVLTASGGPFRTWSLEADPQGDGRAGAQASDLVDGTEGHDRFGDADEQGSRTDRGPSSVRAGTGRARRRRPPAIGHPWPGGISATARSSPSSARPTCAFRSPIAWPGRCAWPTPAARLDLARVATLTFEEPDLMRFPALALARRALAAGGAAPTVLNAANEIAVR